MRTATCMIVFCYIYLQGECMLKLQLFAKFIVYFTKSVHLKFH